jgi:hypothetical protein
VKTTITILLALAFAGFLTTAQAQTGPALVPKWTNTTVFANQASVNGGAFNPATGHLLVCQASSSPASIVICGPLAGARIGTLNTNGVSGGTYTLSGLAIDASGVIYASSYASGGCSLYSWANESAAPVNFANPGGGAGNIGQTMAEFGTGTNAVFILSSSFVPLYVYGDGTNWQSKQLNVGSGTVQGGISIISWSPSNCVFITKNSSGAGDYNTFDPGASSPITVTQTAYTSSPLWTGHPGPVQGAGGYDPATGLFGFHSRTSVTNTLNNYLVLTTSNTLAAPGGCSPVVSTVVVQTSGADSVNGFGADFWGNGVFYSVPAQLASKGFGFRAYDVTAFPVADISPASITTNTGASVTFSVVSCGSSLSYQWQVNTVSNYVNVSGSEFSGANSNTLTISPAGTNDTGSYLCTVTGVSGSGWISSAASLTVVPSSTVPIGGVAYADSSDFTLNTVVPSPPMGGVAWADSTDFTLNTLVPAPPMGGVAWADSTDFTLNTLVPAPPMGGVAYADSTDFTLNTLVPAPPMAGVAYADSTDFTLNTGGTLAGLAGVAFADSSDFTLNTLINVVIGLPHFTSISVNGRTLILNATNGSPGGQYTLLGTTNLALNLWTTILTGTFDSGGSLNLIATNLINPAAKQQFYMLRQ